MTIKKCENKCPECGEEVELKWDDYRVYDCAMEIPGYCKKCKCEFIEYFDVLYKETSFKE